MCVHIETHIWAYVYSYNKGECEAREREAEKRESFNLVFPLMPHRASFVVRYNDVSYLCKIPLVCSEIGVRIYKNNFLNACKFSLLKSSQQSKCFDK